MSVKRDVAECATSYVTLSPGTRIGPYEVTSLIGAGGMGEVYLASDTNLLRHVAIKVLPEAVAQDRERLARFDREARTLAALNHPHIAQIYGLERSSGMTALVMEWVEGSTLADLIVRSPGARAASGLPVDEALAIARQIAEALEAAHEQGIIHRDLKPANIKVTRDGTVKVLDFGLAKVVTPASSVAGTSQAPTVTTPVLLTGTGVILGTAAYMSPEQARGHLLDRRTDLWSFGAVVFELLTGRRAFSGDSTEDALAAVLAKDPQWETLPAEVPDGVRRLLQRCLQKDRTRRLDSATVAKWELEDALQSPTGHTASPTLPTARHVAPLWGALGVAVLAAGSLAVPAVQHLREQPSAVAEQMRTDIVTPDSTEPLSLALSPNAHALAFVAGADGETALWVRDLGVADARSLPGTEGATYPFWAPDGQTVGFFADGQLKRVEVTGGAPPQTLASTGAVARGGTWNRDNVVMFAPSGAGPLFRLTSQGGTLQQVSTLAAGQAGHRFPQFLPDGRRFLFYAVGREDAGGIFLGSLDSSDTLRVTPAETAGVFVSPGWLLWVRGGALVAQRLDVDRGTLVGDLVTVADKVAVEASEFFAGVSVAEAGAVAYRGGTGVRQQLEWLDRSGRTLGALGEPRLGGFGTPSIAPDGRRVAVSLTTQGNPDIWVVEDERTSRLTFDAGVDRFPVWSFDGNQIAFTSDRTGQSNIYITGSAGGGTERLLVGSDQYKNATDWSPDGQYLLYMSQAEASRGGFDIWVQPLSGDRQPWPLLQTSAAERDGRYSPDGRWVAYTSTESGRREVYVRPSALPGTSSAAVGQWQISTAGGAFPYWAPDGRELYFLNLAREMMAAPITGLRDSLEHGQPTMLFRAPSRGLNSRQYDVSRDGRFLFVTTLDDDTPPIRLIQHWTPAVR
jgi:Tol biopolymer transport system component